MVKEGGKETKTPETLGLICNVAIVQHKGKLQTRWELAFVDLQYRQILVFLCYINSTCQRYQPV